MIWSSLYLDSSVLLVQVVTDKLDKLDKLDKPAHLREEYRKSNASRSSFRTHQGCCNQWGNIVTHVLASLITYLLGTSPTLKEA